MPDEGTQDGAAGAGTTSLEQHVDSIEWGDLDRAELEELALDAVVEVRERAIRELAERDAPEELEEPTDPQGALVAALARAQAAFPPIAKTKTAVVTAKPGKAGYSYRYADLADVLAATRPVLAKHGLALIQRTVYLEGAKLHLVTSLKHVGGGVEESVVELGKSPNDPQAFGGSLTYLRRYELVTLLGIQADEDADAHNVADLEQAGPSWTAAADEAQTEHAIRGAADVIGRRESGEAFVKALASRTGGTIPAVVALWLGAMPKWVESARNADKRDAAAATEEQDRAGEDPDEVAAQGRSIVEQDAIEAEHRGDAGEPVYTDSDEPAAIVDTSAPLPGTVEPPPMAALSKLPTSAAKVAAYRSLGCVCENPLADGGDRDECPIKGHGIPF